MFTTDGPSASSSHISDKLSVLSVGVEMFHSISHGCFTHEMALHMGIICTFKWLARHIAAMAAQVQSA